MADKESFAALFEGSSGRSGGKPRIRTGERLEVRIVSIGKNAVFADLGEAHSGGKVDGLFERPDLTNREGELMVEVGSTVSATVAGYDDVAGQVRLTPVFVRSPAREGDAITDDSGTQVRIPVARGGPMLVEGARIRGAVTGVERYGVFVQIEGAQGRGGRGLIPVSETNTPRGADLKKLFPVGSAVDAKILAIAEDGKIRLSVRGLTDDDERKNFEAYARGTESTEAAPEAGAAVAAKPGEKKAKAPPPAPRNFGTLGDLLKRPAGVVAKAPAAKPAATAPKKR